jgi:hypothetical protein
MCCDYGFRTGAGRMYQDKYGQIPKSAWHLVGAARKGTGGCCGLDMMLLELLELQGLSPL